MAPLRISIVTPCLNDARYLEDCLRSIHDPGYAGLEHIVIDGGSTDGSVEIIRRYADRLAHWVSEPDAGHADALYKGLSRATGDVLTWVCSNDMLLPGALARVAEHFAARPGCLWAVGNGLLIDEASRVTERVWAVPFTVRSIQLWEMWGTCQPATFIRRGALERAGGINRSLNVCVDTDLFLRLARLQVPERIPHFLAALRIHRDSQSQVHAARVRETDERLKSASGRPAWPVQLRKLAYRFYYLRYRGVQVLNETLRRRKDYTIGASVWARAT